MYRCNCGRMREQDAYTLKAKYRGGNAAIGINGFS